MLQRTLRVDSIHARELIIECIQSKKSTRNTHVVAIAGKGRAYDQPNRCSEECIAAKAEILRAHGEDVQKNEQDIILAISSTFMTLENGEKSAVVGGCRGA